MVKKNIKKHLEILPIMHPIGSCLAGFKYHSTIKKLRMYAFLQSRLPNFGGLAA